MCSQLLKEKKQEESTAKIPDYVLKQETAGAQRIMIQLEGNPKAIAYIQKYENIVDKLVKKFRESKANPTDNLEFIATAWEFLYKDLKITYGDEGEGFLSASLDNKRWDCENTSFLVFDAAKKLGFKAKLIEVPSHMLVSVGDACFESTVEEHPFCIHLNELSKFYPSVIAIAESPNQTAAMNYVGLATSESKKGKYLKSIAESNKALSLWSDYPHAFDTRGAAKLNLNDVDAALYDFNHSLELNPNNGIAYSFRGNIFSRLNQYSKAMSDLNKALSLLSPYSWRDMTNSENGALSEVYSNRGYVFHKMGNKKKALDDFSLAIKAYSKSPSAYARRALVYSELEEYSKAIRDYNTAVGLDPSRDMLYGRAYVYHKMEDYKKAITDLDIILKTNRKDSDAYNLRGSCNRHLANYESAISDYQKAIQIEPKNAGFYSNLGIAYGYSGQYDKALENHNKAIRMEPDSSNFYNNRGVTYRLAGQYEKALDDFNEAIEIDPENHEAYLERSRTYMELGKIQEAAEDSVLSEEIKRKK